MVLGLVTSMSLAMFEYLSKRWSAKYALITLFLGAMSLVLTYDNIQVHLNSLSHRSQNFWPLLIVYSHVALFELFSRKKHISLSIIVLPLLMLVDIELYVKVAFLLGMSFFRLNKLSFFIHLVGLFLALCMRYNEVHDIAVISMFGLYLLSVFNIIFKQETSYDTEKLVYVLLNLVILNNVSSKISYDYVEMIGAGFPIILMIITFFRRKTQSHLVPFSLLVLLSSALLFDILELIEVLPLLSIVSSFYIENGDRNFFNVNGKAISFEYLNNIKVLLFIISGFYLVQSTQQNGLVLLLSILCFCFYFMASLGFERKSKLVRKSDLFLGGILLIDLGGILWLN